MDEIAGRLLSLEKLASQRQTAKVVHYNATAGAEMALLDFGELFSIHKPPYALYSIFIHNTHTSNTLYVSFDRGATWKDVPPKGNISFNAPIDGVISLQYPIQVKASGSGTTYQCLFSVKSVKELVVL